jgi:hypothetical protein
MRVLLTGLAFVLTLAVLLAGAASLTSFSAGPHASALPAWLDAVLCTALWFAAIALPTWIATRVWSRLQPTPPADPALPGS